MTFGTVGLTVTNNLGASAEAEAQNAKAGEYMYSCSARGIKAHFQSDVVHWSATRKRLVVGLLLLENGLVKPVLLGGGLATLSGLTLDLGDLALVCGKFAGNVGLLGRCGCLGDGEGVDVTLGIGRLNGGDLVGLELAQVQVLNQVGYCAVSGLDLDCTTDGW